MRLKSNKKFDYKPRFYEGEGNPYKMEQPLDKFRNTTARGLKGKMSSAVRDLRTKGDKNMKMRFWIIFAILIFLFLYIIDFDLTIFTQH